MRGFYFIIIFSSILLGACSYHELKGSQTKSMQQTFNDTQMVDATTVQQSVLFACARCHSGTNQPYLGTTADIERNITKVQKEVTSNAMPPSDSGYTPLSNCQKDISAKWIADGFPINSSVKVLDLPSCAADNSTPPANLPILSMPLNYQTLTTEILQPKCLHCHNSNSSDPDASKILLYPFDKMVAHKNLLGPDSAHSKLYRIVSRTDDERMPPPEDSVPLSADQQEFIKRWLDKGHPEK